MTFRAGQKVVCADNNDAQQLVLKGIYTVKKDVGTGRYKRKDTGEVGRWQAILLHEAEPDAYCIGFDGRRFRPIVEKKTDISIFKEMLKGTGNVVKRAKEYSTG